MDFQLGETEVPVEKEEIIERGNNNNVVEEAVHFLFTEVEKVNRQLELMGAQISDLAAKMLSFERRLNSVKSMREYVDLCDSDSDDEEDEDEDLLQREKKRQRGEAWGGFGKIASLAKTAFHAVAPLAKKVIPGVVSNVVKGSLTKFGVPAPIANMAASTLGSTVSGVLSPTDEPEHAAEKVRSHVEQNLNTAIAQATNGKTVSGPIVSAVAKKVGNKVVKVMNGGKKSK